MWRYLLPIVLFAILIGFFIIGLRRDKEVLPSPLIGKPAPQFTLPRVDDPSKQISNAEFAGRPYVVNVWATWCVGCRQEHDALLEIARRGEAPLIGLNWKDDLELARQWLAQLGDPYVVSAFDQDGSVAIDWGVYGAPETFLVGADGSILYKHISPITLEIWEREFAPRIKQSGARE